MLLLLKSRLDYSFPRAYFEWTFSRFFSALGHLYQRYGSTNLREIVYDTNSGHASPNSGNATANQNFLESLKSQVDQK